MSAKHTPGPWSFGYYGCNGYCINAPGIGHIATSILYKRDGGDANARLIAAAPELLEAMLGLMRTFPTDGDMLEANWDRKEVDAACAAHERARQVYLKATGSAT